MASKISKAIENGELYCTINSQPLRKWRDFTLQKGHIFGYSPELKRDGRTGFFVVYQMMDEHIVVYSARLTRDCYVWKPYIIEYGCKTADRIQDVSKKRIGGVQRVDRKYDFSSFYNPNAHIVTEPFIPMPHMRIPMGARKDVLLESHKPISPLYTSATSYDELRENEHTRKMTRVLRNIHENNRRKNG